METENEKAHTTTNTGRVKGKRPVIIGVVVIILTLVIAQACYSYVLPRVSVEFRTIYHEATGGGGTGGLVNINSKYINSGTLEVRDFIMSIRVFDSARTLLVNDTATEDILSPGQSSELKLITNGNCYERFYIELEVQFGSENDEYYEKYNYATHEDAMNIAFTDSIFDWGF